MSKQRVDEEGMGPLERGRGRYQQQDYDSALHFFNDVGIGYMIARDYLHLEGVASSSLSFTMHPFSSAELRTASTAEPLLIRR